MNIGSLARQLGTTPHSIRFYEWRGLIPGPDRNPNGYREYNERDAQRLRGLCFSTPRNHVATLRRGHRVRR